MVVRTQCGGILPDFHTLSGSWCTTSCQKQLSVRYSHRLSIIHFYRSLIFLYVSGLDLTIYYMPFGLGAVIGYYDPFLSLLLLPSWGGMLNGLFTLRGAWDKVRDRYWNSSWKVGVTCYGMATFEGRCLSLKMRIQFLTIRTGLWRTYISYVGWNGFLTFRYVVLVIAKIQY